MIEEDPEEQEIPINIAGPQLTKIIEYAKIILEVAEPKIKAPLTNSKFGSYVPKPLEDFFKMPKQELFSLMAAADYLKMEGLLGVIGTRIACHLKKMTDDEKREYLNLEDDLSIESKSEIQKENQDLRMLLPEEAMD